jgi:hypothetical protein
MKIQKNSSPVSPFSGIAFVNNEFDKSGLPQLIDNELGKRQSTKGYTYSNVIKNLGNVFYCGGDCAEDIQSHVGNDLKLIPGNVVSSADTILRVVKELATDNSAFVSQQGKSYNFNINKKLNSLNIKSLVLTKQLVAGQSYDFDYDNQIIPTDKYDTKRTYKQVNGYCPGIATIGDKIVYIENRDGNANVKFEQAATLTRAYKVLTDNDIKVNRSRMDAGSYSKEIIDVVAKNSRLFYIRSNRSADLYSQIREIKDWTKVEINCKIYEVASIKFTQFSEKENYRQVIMREANTTNKQLNLFTGDTFNYRSILTNDWESAEKEVIEYYNQRGSSEKTFDIMNNDFGWNHLPCSFLNENTAYLIIMAIVKNFYNYVVEKVSLVFDDIQPTTRLKRFIFRFITVAGKWVYSGRQWVLKLYSERPYDLLAV